MPFFYRQVLSFANITIETLGENSRKIIYKDFKSHPQVEHGVLTQAAYLLKPDAQITFFEKLTTNDQQGNIVSQFECIIQW